MQSLTTKQIFIVCESFENAFALCPDLGSRLYDQLLLDHRRFRDTFNSVGMRAQHSRFISMFHIILLRMKDGLPLTDMLSEIGIRHARYGLKEEDFEVFGAVLIQVMKDALKDAFNEDLFAAWTAVYQEITGAMKAAT